MALGFREFLGPAKFSLLILIFSFILFGCAGREEIQKTQSDCKTDGLCLVAALDGGCFDSKYSSSNEHMSHNIELSNQGSFCKLSCKLQNLENGMTVERNIKYSLPLEKCGDASSSHFMGSNGKCINQAYIMNLCTASESEYLELSG